MNSSFLAKSLPNTDRRISGSSSSHPFKKSEKFYINEITLAKRRLFRCIASSYRMDHSFRSKIGELRKKSLNDEKRQELEKATEVICRNCAKKDLEFEQLKKKVQHLEEERASWYGPRRDY
jgi:hypothetical protein